MEKKKKKKRRKKMKLIIIIILLIFFQIKKFHFHNSNLYRHENRTFVEAEKMLIKSLFKEYDKNMTLSKLMNCPEQQ